MLVKAAIRVVGPQIEFCGIRHRTLYLTTVDENIAGNVIEDMASFGINLVVPESLKESKETEYVGHDNVLGFREFCESAVRPHLPDW